jgi:predicted PurR-regulated permease PerM
VNGGETQQVIAMLRWLLIAVFVVLGWIVTSYLASVLAPILAALGIAYLLSPVLDRLVHRGFNRTLGAAMLLSIFIALIITAIAFVAPRAAEQVAQFFADLPQMLATLDAWTQAHLGFALPQDWRHYVSSENVGVGAGPLRELATAAVGGVFHVAGSLAEFLLVPVFSFYFLVDWPDLLRRADHVIPPRRRHEVRGMVREIDAVVAGWVRGQAIVTTMLATFYATGFTIVGMPLSLPIGLVVGALTVIPFVGTFVGAAVAATVTIAAGGTASTLGGVAIVILCLHLLEAGVLTPKIVGHRVGLSESGALFAVLAGGKLLGFVGVVLAVPIAATCAVLVRYGIRYYEHTAFFGHESDADVVITPAMAMIMPGIVPGAKIVAEPVLGEHREEILDDEYQAADGWDIEPELGAAGGPPKPSSPPRGS